MSRVLGDTPGELGVTSHDRAVAVLRALIKAGMREVVLAPGSRSAPLALAAHAAEIAGALRLHVRIDERTAGFLALGLAIGSRRPVAVVTTSGTAVGNLVPAVMEAHHSGRPLVVISADRPAELRGTGANQTTWQTGIFGRFAPCVDLAATLGPDATADAVTHVMGPESPRGPVHLNVQFDSPLLPKPGMPWWSAARSASTPESTQTGEGVQVTHRPPTPNPGGPFTAYRDVGRRPTLERGPRTVVVAGDEAGPAARALAEAGGWPLLAEPTSGARVGDHAIRAYRILLGGPLATEIERVIVVGHPTLSRPQTALLTRGDVELIAIRGPGGVATDPAGRAAVVDVVPEVTAEGASDPAEVAWLLKWRALDTQVCQGLDALVEALPELDALQVAAVVGRAETEGAESATLFVGSSNPIRDLDLMLPVGRVGGRRFVVANRGLAGIDGSVSTAIGVALTRPPRDGGRSVALLGDVTFLHDTTGLAIGPHEPRPDLTVIVVNDNGGSIFSLLEQGSPEYAASFERVFATPHGVDLSALCQAGGTAYRCVRTRAELAAALADPSPGLRVVEARVSRDARRATAVAIAALSRIGEDDPMSGASP